MNLEKTKTSQPERAKPHAPPRFVPPYMTKMSAACFLGGNLKTAIDCRDAPRHGDALNMSMHVETQRVEVSLELADVTCEVNYCRWSSTTTQLTRSSPRFVNNKGLAL